MRLSISLMILLVVPCAATAKQDLVKGPDAETYAVILDCNSCKDGKGKECQGGVAKGYHDGAACGQCLLESNFGTRIDYPYDIHITGTVKDEKGKPLEGKFVQVSLPNTWRIRTRTLNDGSFRMMLGATATKKSDKVLVVDLGDRTMPTAGDSEYYSLFMLQEHYKPCSNKE